MTRITVQTTVKSDIERVWSAWTTPADIVRWNAASDDWHTPRSTNDLRVGGKFTSRMEARDGSMGFDFEGTYTSVVPGRLLEYAMPDGRTVSVTFEPVDGGVKVVESFDAEGTNTAERQQQGWQAILDRFRSYVESKP